MTLMKFYERPSFKRLKAEWYDKLGKSFDDIEDGYENLKTYDRRTQSFEDRDQVAEFFYALDQFLNVSYRLIPTKHWRILNMYSDGKKLTEISSRLGVTDRWVRKIVARYKVIILKSL